MSGDVVLARHADTDWTATGRHTSRTDLPLSAAGRDSALTLGERLRGRSFAAVWCSPPTRASQTAQLAGFSHYEVHEELAEWDYGDYEGRTTADIRREQPDWDLFTDGAPGGENLAAVTARVDRLLGLLPAHGDTLIFSHGHLLRVFTARWLRLDATSGAVFAYAPGALGVLSHERERRVLAELG